MKKLEGKELYRRLQEARNTQRLLAAMRQKMEAMEKTIELLEDISQQKDQIIAFQKETIEKQELRIESLEKMVFGKSKKRKSQDSDDRDGHGGSPPNKKDRKPRDPKSYQREIPKDDEITDMKEYPLGDCPDCGNPLTDKKTVE